MKDVMLDLETFGTGPDAVIVQIGACFFDRATGEIGETFKVNVTPKSAIESGAIMDADTVCWWMNQSEAARKSILAEPQLDIETAMIQLNQFLSPAKAIWSHATFDFVIVTQTLRRLKIKPKFRYQAARDIRTLNDLGKTALTNTPSIRDGVHHDALEDCKFQVKYCVVALNSLL